MTAPGDSRRPPLRSLPGGAVTLVVMSMGCAGALLFVGLADFGIWEPSELSRAEMAAQLQQGAAVGNTSLEDRVLGAAYGLLGPRGWFGRIPMALAAWFTVLCTTLLARRHSLRLAVYAAGITATNAFLLFHGRHLAGNALGLAFQSLAAVGAAWWILPAPAPEGSAGGLDERPLRDLGALMLAAIALITGTVGVIAFEGALLGALPVLGAAAVAYCLALPLRNAASGPRVGPWSLRTVGGGAIVLAALFVAVKVLLAVLADGDAYSLWLGGRPEGRSPPSFEVVLETIFHGFAPWSAALPMALGALMIAPAQEAGDEAVVHSETEFARPFRGFLLTWISLGYVAHTLYASRYGEGVFLPVPALSLAVAWLLLQVDQSARPWRTAAVVTALFGMLLFRDFAAYPDSPLRALPLPGTTFPSDELFQPRRAWGIALGLFTFAISIGLFAARSGPFEPRAPYRFLLTRWHGSRWTKAIIALLGVILALLLLSSGAAWFMDVGTDDPIGLRTASVNALRAVGIVLLAIPLLVLVVQASTFGAGRLGQARFVPAMVAAVGVAGYISWGFVPALSHHLSPQAVFDAYVAHSGGKETLGEFRVSDGITRYYTGQDAEALASVGEASTFLADDEERRWLVFPPGDLASVNKAYRRSEGQHLFIPYAESAKLMLASNQPIAGIDNQNFIAKAVLLEAPTPQHTPAGRFEQAIELLGYDLKLPHDGFAGAGETIEITWYWKALRASPGSYKIFLHIDGQGHRLNGDHDPVEGRYPVHLWEAQDIVADRQVLTVPVNYRSGTYTLYIGFFQGSRRLKVSQGEQDGSDRLIAGRFQVR